MSASFEHTFETPDPSRRGMREAGWYPLVNKAANVSVIGMDKHMHQPATTTSTEVR